MEVSQDIAVEIFSWLPGKSICKLKSTCNSCFEFSEEAVFKTKQARNLFGKDDTCFFIQPDQISQRYTKRVQLHSLPENRQSSGAPNKALSFLSNSICVLASSNGLVVGHTINDHDPIEFFICNPVTKSWSSIPTPESLQRNHSSGSINLVLDCSLDDYKLFLFENTSEWSPTCYTCSVYHSKEGVWTTMESGFSCGGRNMKFDMPVFHKGGLHFISDSDPYFAKSSPFYKPYIMSYNIENGISTMLKLPREAIKGCHNMCTMGIFNWGKKTSYNSSICLVKLSKSVFTIWVLKDYESGSWQKVLKVRVRALGLKEKDPNVRGFMVMNGDLLIFATEEKVYSCGLDCERYMMVEEICQHSCGFYPRFISYSDTLRLCRTNAEVMPC
ncbi:putative F-box domain-containing protein [Medicago truncatula]|uniref:F-box protein interaction domain protein n=1 Tax=Medicago truncatula TaxID=3880 RepID=G7JBB6_MEDTR|nr:F-box protein interaction domain protein [Medicago truncatula]RHN69192.1 putative F-box domain-containing protein [Medicago truncatula]